MDGCVVWRAVGGLGKWPVCLVSPGALLVSEVLGTMREIVLISWEKAK